VLVTALLWCTTFCPSNHSFHTTHSELLSKVPDPRGDNNRPFCPTCGPAPGPSHGGALFRRLVGAVAPAAADRLRSMLAPVSFPPEGSGERALTWATRALLRPPVGLPPALHWLAPLRCGVNAGSSCVPAVYRIPVPLPPPLLSRWRSRGTLRHRPASVPSRHPLTRGPHRPRSDRALALAKIAVRTGNSPQDR